MDMADRFTHGLMMTFCLRLKKKSASLNTQDSSLTSKNWKIPMCWKPSKLWYPESWHFSSLWTKKIQTWTRWSPPSTQLRLKQPLTSLANIVRRGRGDVYHISICLPKIFVVWSACRLNNGTRRQLLHHDNVSVHISAHKDLVFPGLSPLGFLSVPRA